MLFEKNRKSTAFEFWEIDMQEILEVAESELFEGNKRLKQYSCASLEVCPIY